MANIKISELEEYTEAKDSDLLVIVDTTNNETKKIQAGNLGTGGVDIPIQDTAPTNPKSGDFYVDTADNSILKYYQNEKWNDTNITGDTLPIGAIVEYDGTTVPEGYEAVSETNLITGGPAIKSGRIIDGKIEYVKRIDLGQLPAAGEGKSVADGLDHTSILCTKIEGFATDSTGAYQNTLSGFDTRLTLNPDGLSITIKNESYISFTGIADVYYINK